MQSRVDIKGARKSVKTVIDDFFGEQAVKDQKLKFSMKTESFDDLGYPSRVSLTFKDEQDVWNTCYCEKKDCIDFFKKVKEAAREHGVIASRSMIHASPADLEARGKLKC